MSQDGADSQAELEDAQLEYDQSLSTFIINCVDQNVAKASRPRRAGREYEAFGSQDVWIEYIHDSRIRYDTPVGYDRPGIQGLAAFFARDKTYTITKTRYIEDAAEMSRLRMAMPALGVTYVMK